jgi:hypothetical protein
MDVRNFWKDLAYKKRMSKLMPKKSYEINWKFANFRNKLERLSLASLL